MADRMEKTEMKKVFSFVTQPWLLVLIAIILLSLIIWYIGPLIAIAEYKPFASETSCGLPWYSGAEES